VEVRAEGEDRRHREGRRRRHARPRLGHPDRVQSVEYPRLIVDSKSDASRLATGEISVDDATDRALAVDKAVRGALLYPELRGERVGAVGSNPGLYVISCQRWAEPRIITAADRHSAAERAAEGDVVTVRTEYALEVVHDG
jgi:DNA-binding transcriptional regulator YdaS (Cro superfamily)